MKTYIFDIETGPLEEEQLKSLMPEFKAPSNWKDAAKIQNCIEEKQKEWVSKAALAAETGRVLAIGLCSHGETEILQDEDERVVLEQFWKRVAAPGFVNCKLIGFNSNRFDIPFLIRRSWILGVEVPWGMFAGRYLEHNFIDLMSLWQCGDWQSSISLDRMAKALGVGKKTGEGKDFAGLIQSDRSKAIEYLKNDLILTEKCAVALGVIRELKQAKAA